MPIPSNSEVRVAKRRVVCSAIRAKFTGEVIIGIRHYDEWMGKFDSWSGWGDPVDQGFIDQYGVFMDREEAWKVAAAADQIIYRCGGDDKNGGTLYSENLY
jgi:hypothetical protein